MSNYNLVMRTSGQVKESNELHYGCQSIVDKAVKLGVKIKTGLTFSEPSKKVTKEKKVKQKLVRGKVSALDSITSVLSKIKRTTIAELKTLTGFNLATISRVLKILITKGLMTRQTEGKGNAVTLTWVGK